MQSDDTGIWQRICQGNSIHLPNPYVWIDEAEYMLTAIIHPSWPQEVVKIAPSIFVSNFFIGLIRKIIQRLCENTGIEILSYIKM